MLTEQLGGCGEGLPFGPWFGVHRNIAPPQQ
jgi:hypothetical protein